MRRRLTGTQSVSAALDMMMREAGWVDDLPNEQSVIIARWAERQLTNSFEATLRRLRLKLIEIKRRPADARAEAILALAHPAGAGQDVEVTLTAPMDGATVTGLVPIWVDVRGEVERVEFSIDGMLYKVDWSVPFSAVWNAGGLIAGSHLIEARAFNAAGDWWISQVYVVSIPPAQQTERWDKVAL